MKKLLIFLLLLTFFHEGYSQITQIGGKKSYVEVMGGFFVDSSARMPIGYTYTFTGLDSTARFWYDGPTKSIWYHNGTSRQRIANKAYVDSLVAASSGSGSVTTVTVTTANGVSGVVTNPTTTPAITLTLGAITPSSVNASGTIAGSNFSGSSSGVNTGNQTITLIGDVNGTGTGSFTTALTSIIAPASCNHCAITWDSKGRVTAAMTLSVTTGTVTSITAGAGLSGGTITTSGTIDMPNVGTAGTYGSGSLVPVITTDAQGRVSSVTTSAVVASISYAASIDTQNYSPAAQDTIRQFVNTGGDAVYSEFGSILVTAYTSGSLIIFIGYTDPTGTARTVRVGYASNASIYVYSASFAATGDYSLQPREMHVQAGTTIYLYTSAGNTFVSRPTIYFIRR